MCFSRHGSSFYRHFQVKTLTLVLRFHSGDVLETFDKIEFYRENLKRPFGDRF